MRLSIVFPYRVCIYLPDRSSGILSPVGVIKCLFKEISIVLPWQCQIVIPFFLVSNFNADFDLMHPIYFYENGGHITKIMRPEIPPSLHFITEWCGPDLGGPPRPTEPVNLARPTWTTGRILCGFKASVTPGIRSPTDRTWWQLSQFPGPVPLPAAPSLGCRLVSSTAVLVHRSDFCVLLTRVSYSYCAFQPENLTA